MHIQCDEELISRFDLNESICKISSDAPSTVFGNWNASIIKVLGSQFLLTVHTKSLFSSIDLLDTIDMQLITQAMNNLCGKILEMLSDFYCLTDYQERGIVQPFKNITFGPAENKRMTRITQGMVLAYKKRFLRARHENPNGEIRLWELEDDLNNMPRRNLGGATPAEILRELVWSGVN